MKKALVPIDGSAAAMRALAYALSELAPGEDDEVHLLNVQAPRVHPWPGKLVSPDLVEAEQCHDGERLLAPAQALVEAAGVRCGLHVRIGAAAEQIAECASALGCDAIVMGTRGMGAVGGLVLGSVAQKAVHLAPVPVTLVK